MNSEITSEDLIDNLEKIHTTELGVERIRKNLSLDAPDVVEWCKQKISTASDISHKGKNWYVYVDDCVIIINARSFTIITAHNSKTRGDK